MAGPVAAAIFKMFQAVATGEQVQRDVEYMIGFVVGQVEFEQRNRSIDFLPQIELLGQLQERSDAAGGDGLLLVGKFVLDARRIDHGRRTGPVALIDSPQHLLLACFGFASYLGVHSKPSLGRVD